MSAAMKDARGRRRSLRMPSFWSDVPLREMAVRTHRQMYLREAIALMQAELGRAPSKSALSRFWLALDEAAENEASHTEPSASERQRLIGLVSRHNDERASQAANADHLPKDAGKPRKFLSVLAVLLAAQILRHLFHKQHGAARRAHSRLVGE